MLSEIIKTCVKSGHGDFYTHFGVHKDLAFIWGNKSEDVLEVKLCISDNQLPPNKDIQEYWGWYDFEREDFTIIFPNYILLDVCFTYGIQIEEEHNNGKAYRLEIVKD